MVWTQLILCAVYRDTVLSPNVTTVTVQYCSPLRRRCSCSRTACICNRLETPSWFREPYPWRRYCVSRRCHQFWKIAVYWHTSTVGIEPTAPPPSRSAVRHTYHCATAPFLNKNGPDTAYIMRPFPRHGSLARCYHHHCPTVNKSNLFTTVTLEGCARVDLNYVKNSLFFIICASKKIMKMK